MNMGYIMNIHFIFTLIKIKQRCYEYCDNFNVLFMGSLHFPKTVSLIGILWSGFLQPIPIIQALCRVSEHTDAVWCLCEQGVRRYANTKADRQVGSPIIEFGPNAVIRKTYLVLGLPPKIGIWLSCLYCFTCSCWEKQYFYMGESWLLSLITIRPWLKRKCTPSTQTLQ